MALYKHDEIKTINFDAIPNEMKNVPQWFMWVAKDNGRNDNKLAKYPTNTKGEPIKWTDIDNLYTFDEVKHAYEHSNQFGGISFNVVGSGLTIIDIDMNMHTMDLTPTEKPLLNAGYVEKSVSGRGYHVVLNKALPNDQEKHMYDKDGNRLEVFCNSGFVAITGDVYNNHAQIDSVETSQQFIDYLLTHYQSHNVSVDHTEPHTAQETVTGTFNPPNLNTSNVVGIWYDTGGHTLKTRNISKRDLWERSDKAMQSYNHDLSVASYSLITELAYFLWDKPNELYDLILNNPYWNEQDNYMKANAKRLKHDIKKAIAQRKRSGNVYQSAKDEQTSLLTHYNNSNASNNLESFINGIKDNANTPPTSTGFTILDKTLQGGIREGLYVIGAISSLGKTTLVQHIADNIAKNGTDVLFISLEMARTELMSKSISRETYLDTIENNGDISNAKASLDITDGSKHNQFSDVEKALIKTGIKRYSEYAEHMYIVEAFGQIGHDDVRELVGIHKERTGRTPIVIIDYLQILKPSDPRQTDKANTDASVNALKQLSRDYKTTVLAISSLNRESYSRPMTLSSFKESGAIEYSSDVLIGLDFTKMLLDASSIDFEEEKDKAQRNITLTILKNRNGRTGGRINYLYNPRFNHFDEDDYYTAKEKPKKRYKTV